MRDTGRDLVCALALGESLGDSEFHLQRHHLLLRPVVKVTFQSMPFFVLGCDQAPPRLAHFRRPLLELVVEAFVAKHQTPPRGDVSQQFPVCWSHGVV